MKGWIKGSVIDAFPICVEQSRSLPPAGESLFERAQINFPEGIQRHPAKIQVGGEKIHHYAGTPSSGVAMPSEHLMQGHYITCCFKRVEVVGLLAQVYSLGTQLFVSFLVADAYTAPIIALQQNEGTAKCVRVPMPSPHNSIPRSSGRFQHGWNRLHI